MTFRDSFRDVAIDAAPAKTRPLLRQVVVLIGSDRWCGAHRVTMATILSFPLARQWASCTLTKRNGRGPMTTSRNIFRDERTEGSPSAYSGPWPSQIGGELTKHCRYVAQHLACQPVPDNPPPCQARTDNCRPCLH